MSNYDHFISKLKETDTKPAIVRRPSSSHVFYGGADRFSRDTPAKLGKLALANLQNNSGSFVDFAKAVWLPGAESLPESEEQIQALEFKIADDPETARDQSPYGWLAWVVHRRVLLKLETQPIEEFRIDFEDGYGFREDETEDKHAIEAAKELVALQSSESKIKFPRIGVRVKSFQNETRERSFRTLDLFLKTLVDSDSFPEDLVVVLPKVTDPVETSILNEYLRDFETKNSMQENSIAVEFLVETAEVIGHIKEAAESCIERLDSVHFGAYDYTSAFEIASTHQHLRHDACNFARNEMLVALAPLGVDVVDSVTIEMPISVHKGRDLMITEIAENKISIRNAWRRHFSNITNSMINGFYRSWDLHPGQLPARYAAVYSFFLESFDEEAKRLRGFFAKATQAMTTGNVFDDAASAEGLMNYFRRGIAAGAFSKDEVCEAIDITSEEFDAPSFGALMEMRR